MAQMAPVGVLHHVASILDYEAPGFLTDAIDSQDPDHPLCCKWEVESGPLQK